MRILSTPLAREIAVLLAVKASALVVIWALFFGPQQRPDIAPSDIGTHLIGTAAPVGPPPSRSAHD